MPRPNNQRDERMPSPRIRRFPLAVNLSSVFRDLPMIERPAAARRAGFTEVETWWPFHTAHPAGAEVDELIAALDAADVRLVALNLYAGDMAAGVRGVLNLPDAGPDVEDSVAVARQIAQRTGCRRFNALYGQLDAALPEAEQHRLARERLAYAAAELADDGGTVLVEPLAAGANGAYPLLTADDVLSAIDETDVRTGRLALLLDTYHLTTNGVDVDAVLEQHADRIGHVQIADVPGRGEPGSGSFDFGRFFRLLDASPYDGYVALEYFPVENTPFAWAASLDVELTQPEHRA